MAQASRLWTLAPSPNPLHVFMVSSIDYEVRACANVPAGLPRQRLAVLSPIWRGKSLCLEYLDGTKHTLQGWSGPEPGEPVELQVFWTRHHPQGPPVCLAIGGDHGLRDLGPRGIDAPAQGYPFLALAESLIPLEILEVIGPAPRPEKDREILLLA